MTRRSSSPSRLLSLAAALSACAPATEPAPRRDAAAPAAGEEAGPSARALAAPPEIIARLDGAPIRLDEVLPPVAFQVYLRQVDIYSLLQRETERLVGERLLGAEAARRGTSPAALLAGVEAAVAPASRAEAEAYERQQPEARADPGGRERLRAYLTARKREQARLDFLDALRRRARLEMVLSPPERPRARMEVAGARARGPADAPLTVVHFATLGSEASARSAAYLRRLATELGGRVRWVHRDLLEPHDEQGLRAAAVGLAAAERGRFWDLHDRLLAPGAHLQRGDLEKIAGELGIHEPPVALVARELPALKRELDVARALGIETPPVIFVNGRYFSPTFPYEDLARLAREELARGQAGGGSLR
jgi:protein-disulfide isomerase